MGSVQSARVKEAIADAMQRFRNNEPPHQIVDGFLLIVGGHISTRGINRERDIGKKLSAKCEEGEEALQSFLNGILEKYNT